MEFLYTTRPTAIIIGVHAQPAAGSPKVDFWKERVRAVDGSINKELARVR